MPSPGLTSESEALVPVVRAGNREAFEALFRTHYAPLCRFAEILLRSSDAAEDVVQDVFFRIWNQHDSWKVQGSVRAYLYSAVRNRALNLLKQRAVHQRAHERAEQEGSAPGMGATPSGADEQMHSEEVAAAVHRAIAALPERARLVVTLRWQHGLRYAEIAETMGISVKGVENQLARSLKSLREHLSDWSA